MLLILFRSRSIGVDLIDLSYEYNQEIVELSFDFLEYLNFSDYFERINEVIVFLLFLFIFSDSDFSDSVDNSIDFMDELIKLSKKQQNDVVLIFLSFIDYYLKG